MRESREGGDTGDMRNSINYLWEEGGRGMGKQREGERRFT